MATDASEVTRPTTTGDATTSPMVDPVLRAPRSAGVAGIIFAVLFIAASWLVSPRPPDGLDAAGLVDWFQTTARTSVSIATLYLAPFAGIAFLWFIGVVRARIGSREDQLFSTVFLGSGLLFVAMYWAGAAQLVSLLGENRYDAAPTLTAEAIEGARSEAYAFLFVLAARAAGVFVLVTSTIILRGRIMPKAIAYVGYLIALVMLLSVSALQWIVLLFPVWVLVVSLFVLVEDRLAGRADDRPAPAPAT